MVGRPQSSHQQSQLALSEAQVQQLEQLSQLLAPTMPEDGCTIAWCLDAADPPALQILGVLSQLPWPLPPELTPVRSTSGSRPASLGPAAGQSSSASPPYTAHCLAQDLPATPGQAIAPALVTQDLQAHSLSEVMGLILVLPTCQPDDLPWLQKAAGIICEMGGLTSHGAILARELGLPAVVGYSEATSRLKTGQLIGLDGDYGTIYDLGDQGSTLEWSHPAPVLASDTQDWALQTQVWVTLSQAEALQQVEHLPIDGLGLLRSEWLMLTALERQHPQEWIDQGKQQQLTETLFTHLQPFVATFQSRPVFYRSLDGRSNELATLQGGGNREAPEANPMLGLRGTARYPAAAEVFDCELAAIAKLYQQGYDNMRLLLPFVRSVDEFEWCKARIEAAGLYQYPQFQVWVMAEVPSVLFLLPEYVAAGVQGLAIGSNDFTQLILGVDREQPVLADYFDAMHPAVVRAMAQLVRSAKTLGIPCSICGQAPVQHPQLIPQLVEWGISAITVDLQTVAKMRRLIAQAEQQVLFQSLREHSSGSDAKSEDGLR